MGTLAGTGWAIMPYVKIDYAYFYIYPAFKRTHGKFSDVASVVNCAVLEDLYNEKGLEFNLRQTLKRDQMPICIIDENLSVLSGLVKGGLISTAMTGCYASV